MLKKYIFDLDIKEPLPIGTAYQCYGFLTEQLPTDMMTRWHDMQKTPLRQYLYFDRKTRRTSWHISLMGEESVRVVGPVLDNMNALAMHNHPEIPITLRETVGFDSAISFATKFLVEDPPSRILTWRFNSPTSFKSNETYQMTPTFSLLFQSLIQSWENYSEQIILSDDTTLDALCDYSKLQSYQLRSTRYLLKKTRIPGFWGKLTLRHVGPDPLLRLTNLLWAFSSFAGVGIKTTLGMGGVTIEAPQPRKS